MLSLHASSVDSLLDDHRPYGEGLARSSSYPGDHPYNGGHLRQCTGNSSLHGSHRNKITCDMTPGASGGGWLIQYDGRAGKLNGVFSQADDGEKPTISISPYFGDGAAVLFNDTKNN